MAANQKVSLKKTFQKRSFTQKALRACFQWFHRNRVLCLTPNLVCNLTVGYEKSDFIDAVLYAQDAMVFW